MTKKVSEPDRLRSVLQGSTAKTDLFADLAQQAFSEMDPKGEWEKLAADVRKMKEDLATMKSWGDPAEAALSLALAAVEGKATPQQNQYAQALKEFPPLKERVASALKLAQDKRKKAQDERDWLNSKGEYAALLADVTELEKLVPGTTIRATAVKPIDDASGLLPDYGRAIAQLQQSRRDVRKALTQIKQHDLVMVAINREVKRANDVPGGNLAADQAKARLASAAKAVAVGRADFAQKDALPQLRKDLRDAASAVVEAYSRSVTGATLGAQPWFDKEVKEALVQHERATRVPRLTPAITQDLQQLDLLYQNFCNVKNNSLADLPAKIAALNKWRQMADQILAARPTTDPEEAAAFKEFRKIYTQVMMADLVARSFPKATPEIAVFTNTYAGFNQLWSVGRLFDACLKKVPELKQAAEAVLAWQRRQMELTVDLQLGQPVGTKQKADATAQMVNGTHPAFLQLLDPERQVKLAKALAPEAGPPTSPPTPNPPRQALIKMYSVMQMDEKFLQADDAKRKDLLDNKLTKMPLVADLRNAQKNWNTKPETPQLKQQKQKALQAIADAQCETFKFKGVTIVCTDFQTDPTPVVQKNKTAYGFFNKDNNSIYLNTSSDGYNDFEMAVDLIVHENSHNYQDQLAARLHLDPLNNQRLKPTDAEYQQALQFDLFNLRNDKGEQVGYVTGEENYAVYKTQPNEAHSWYAGPETASALVQTLATLP
jgi:hypothetical protein